MDVAAAVDVPTRDAVARAANDVDDDVADEPGAAEEETADEEIEVDDEMRARAVVAPDDHDDDDDDDETAVDDEAEGGRDDDEDIDAAATTDDEVPRADMGALGSAETETGAEAVGSAGFVMRAVARRERGSAAAAWGCVWQAACVCASCWQRYGMKTLQHRRVRKLRGGCVCVCVCVS